MIPQVDTVAQASHVVAAKLFGSHVNGTRSCPPARLLPGYSADVVNPYLPLALNLNDQAALFIQTESMLGINNLDAILSEPGVGNHIDGVWLGALDLRASMGLDGISGDEPEFLAAVAKWEATVRKHNKPLMGFAVGPPEVTMKQTEGKAFVLVAWDHFSLMAAATPLSFAKENFSARNWAAINEAAVKKR